jgi:predicted RNase H-like HicB family nuclease
MIKLAYIQKKDGEFMSEAAFCFWKGCHALGISN